MPVMTALQQVLKKLDDVTKPELMSKLRYLEFLNELREELGDRAECVRSELSDDELEEADGK